MNREPPPEPAAPTTNPPRPPCPACGAIPQGDDLDAPCPRCGRGDWFTWSRSDDGAPVARPKYDLRDPGPLDQFLKSVEFRPGDRLILDLSDVHYIASEALGRLLSLRKRLIGAQGRLTLRHLDADLQEILRVTRLASFFEIEP
ncbi:STAS domain-containing protein [Planctomyces sp. SH-PL62]|uniref:STAS domain-containing protein n=1 Tax=Planctomyces sp. SH-PL62 TaxID=1636152 RepID=UPI00078C73B1|nr:STAS domain-containing protein [Planctomyces sp. SH-PL62]AMV37200.1 hypothetical protein VT85_07195 [Planctomyces sp. SH-PL62]